jgi:hypothetical protein
MSPEDIETMMKDNPAQAMNMAKDAIQPYLSHLSDGWAKGMTDTPQAVAARDSEQPGEGEKDLAEMEPTRRAEAEALDPNEAKNKETVDKGAQESGVHVKVDQATKTEVEKMNAVDQADLASKEQVESDQAHQLTEHVKAEQDKKREHGFLADFVEGVDTKE